MLRARPGIGHFSVRERPPVRQDVYGCIRQGVSTLRKQPNEPLPIQKRLSASEPKRSCLRVDQWDGCFDLVQYPSVVHVARWLRAHETVVITTLGYQKRIVLGRASVERTKPAAESL